jgi:hypothetical protein
MEVGSGSKKGKWKEDRGSGQQEWASTVNEFTTTNLYSYTI